MIKHYINPGDQRYLFLKSDNPKEIHQLQEHLNKIPQSQYYGWQTFYKKKSEEGKKLATSIQMNLNEAIQKENKRVPLEINNVYIIKHVEIPTCIVECGFLSNEEEEKELQTEDYQEKLAWGICNGIMDYFVK